MTRPPSCGSARTNETAVAAHAVLVVVMAEIPVVAVTIRRRVLAGLNSEEPLERCPVNGPRSQVVGQ